MSWLLSILVGFLTAAAGGVIAGAIASGAVSWYRISSFEGGSGYFVVGMIILGLMAGLLIGVIGARIVAAGPNPGFLKALGVGVGVVVGLGVLIGGAARLLADVPPTVGGQELHVMVEVRWPEGEPVPDPESTRARIALGSVSGARVLRGSSDGPLWLGDVRLEEGRQVVPGAVELFTERGKRVIDIQVGDSSLAGFLLPIPRRPGRRHFEWSPWYPTPRGGSEPWPPHKFSIRYRIQPRDQPVRVDRIGDFEVATIAWGFWAESGGRLAASAEHLISHRGQPVDFAVDTAGNGPVPGAAHRAQAVGVVGGATPALVAAVPGQAASRHCYLVVPAGDSARVERIGPCGYTVDADLLTSDTARFWAHRSRTTVRGTIDRVTYREPGRYQVGDAVLDTRRLTIQPLPQFPSETSQPSDVPPLGISPDERSLVRFVYHGYSVSTTVLLDVDLVAGTATMLPIDRNRMRYAEGSELDPAWVLHHFEWVRGADGIDRLRERPNFTPLPYRGRISTAHDGGHYYTLKPAGQALADAVVEFLVAELGGTVLPRGEYATSDKVRIGERTVSVMATGSAAEAYVMVSLEIGEKDPALIPDVARRFDAALASGRYDALFGVPES